MNLKFILIIIFCSAISCSQLNNKNSELIIVNTEMAPIKQEWTISWLDSCITKFAKKDYTYPKLDYDSAKLLYYNGYNAEEGLDTSSFFPLNKDGKWISTIINSTTVPKADLVIVDSLLGSQKSFDENSAAGRQCPELGIVYFKTGKVIGQTTLGRGSQTIRTTFRQIRKLFYKQLHVY
jgi:hypothetical protein